MTARMIFAASLLSGLWIGEAQANPPEGPPPPPHGPGGPPGFGPGPGPMPPPLLEADVDKDGRITHAEIDAAIAVLFKKADTNGDRTLDEKEFAASMPKRPEPPKPPEGAPKPPEGWPPPPPFDPAARFHSTDWNSDGKLSPDEFAVPMKAMAIHADRNGDGTISQDELQRPPHGPRPPH